MIHDLGRREKRSLDALLVAVLAPRAGDEEPLDPRHLPELTGEESQAWQGVNMAALLKRTRPAVGQPTTCLPAVEAPQSAASPR